MPTILEAILPIFVLVALGYQAGRSRVLTNTMAQGLSRFVTHYALPSLLFSTIAKAKIPETIEWGFVLSFYLAALTVFALGALAWIRTSSRPAELASVGLASSFSNIGALGVPLILNTYGTAGAIPLLLLLPFQSPLLITTATLVAELRRASGARLAAAIWGVIRSTLTSPMIIGIFLGLLVNLTQVKVPVVIMSSTSLLGQALLPCSSFAIGASLALGPVRGSLPHAAGMTFLKTVLHPALTWLLASNVFMLPADWIAPAVTAAALPIGVTAYLFAERYKSGGSVVSMSLLLSTIFSPVSITIAYALTSG